FTQRPNTEVQRAKPVEVGGGDYFAGSGGVTQDNRSADRHSFNGGARLGKDQIIGAEDLFRIGGQIAGSDAEDVEGDAGLLAGLPQRAEVGAFRYVVTEGEGTGRPARQGTARPEALQINEVQQNLHTIFRDALLAHQPVAAGIVDGDVAQDSGK